MKKEFNKLTKGPLNKDDFDRNGGTLGFLVETFNPLSRVPEGAKVHSTIGSICTVVADYDAVKELDRDPNVIRIEYSRPGGII